MKRIMIMSLAVLLSACVFTACSYPGSGKMQVIPSDPPAEKTPQPEDAENDQGLSEDQIQELIREGIVPEDAENEEGDLTFYDNEKINEALDQYSQRMECTTQVLASNDMLVRVKNANDIVIPKVVVSLIASGAEERQEEFYQVLPGGVIVIPVERGSGELPPAVAAEATVSLNENGYTNIADSISISQQETETGVDFTIRNQSDRPCLMFSVTAEFWDESGVIYAQEKRNDGEIAPGASIGLSFCLPEDMKEQGISYTKVECVVNQAVA